MVMRIDELEKKLGKHVTEAKVAIGKAQSENAVRTLADSEPATRNPVTLTGQLLPFPQPKR